MYVRVHVKAGAKKEHVEIHERTVFSLSVKEPAERNLANGRIRALVAEHFQVPVSRVRIVSGHQSPHKMLALETEEVQ